MNKLIPNIYNNIRKALNTNLHIGKVGTVTTGACSTC